MKIFIICGKARSGKDTVAEIIKNYYKQQNVKIFITHFAKYLKIYTTDYFEYPKDEKPREFLQYLGTEIIRKKLKKEKFLINRILEDLEIMEEFFDVGVVADARFIDEIEDIKIKHPTATSIYVERLEDNNELTDREKAHLSETALNNYNNYDYKIINNNLGQLELDITKILRSEEL